MSSTLSTLASRGPVGRAHLRLVHDTTHIMDEGLMGEFTSWLRSWGAAAATVDARTTVVRQAALAWGGDPVTATTAGLEAWLATPTFSPWTRVTYYGHLRSFFGWMVSAGHRPDDPSLGLRAPRSPKGRPRPLSPEDAARVVEAAAGDLRAWLLLGLYAGLRAHEVAQMRGENIDREALFVRGKGGKDSMIPTHPILWELAQTYPRYGLWFPSTGRAGHVNVKSISRATTRHFSRLGIDGSHHRCRHTYGTSLLRGGANIRVVQTLLRHESLATTELYTDVHEDERRAAVRMLEVA